MKSLSTLVKAALPQTENNGIFFEAQKEESDGSLHVGLGERTDLKQMHMCINAQSRRAYSPEVAGMELAAFLRSSELGDISHSFIYVVMADGEQLQIDHAPIRGTNTGHAYKIKLFNPVERNALAGESQGQADEQVKNMAYFNEIARVYRVELNATCENIHVTPFNKENEDASKGIYTLGTRFVTHVTDTERRAREIIGRIREKLTDAEIEELLAYDPSLIEEQRQLNVYKGFLVQERSASHLPALLAFLGNLPSNVNGLWAYVADSASTQVDVGYHHRCEHATVKMRGDFYAKEVQELYQRLDVLWPQSSQIAGVSLADVSRAINKELHGSE